jgi:hypothetical protein
MKSPKILLSVIATSVALVSQATAFVTGYTSEAAFQSQGTIAYNSTFNDFGTSYGFPGASFTRGDVTYNSTENLTWGNNTPYSTLSDTLIGNNYWTPIDGTIAAGYDMFGFQIGAYGNGTMNFTLTTNLGSYTFLNDVVPNSQGGEIGFRGWVAGSGEYFTSFQVVGVAGNGGTLPGLTHVQVGNSGNTQSVPDSGASVALVGLGLVLVAAIRRRLA